MLKQVDEYNKKITLASNMLKKASSELEKKLINAQTKQDSSLMFVNKGFSNLPLPMIAENQKFKIQAPTAANLKSISEKKDVKKVGPRTTAFSTISGLSSLSNSSFLRMVDNPFG